MTAPRDGLPNDEALMDAWWEAMADDWAVPDWAPRKFLAECIERGIVVLPEQYAAQRAEGARDALGEVERRIQAEEEAHDRNGRITLCHKADLSVVREVRAEQGGLVQESEGRIMGVEHGPWPTLGGA